MQSLANYLGAFVYGLNPEQGDFIKNIIHCDGLFEVCVHYARGGDTVYRHTDEELERIWSGATELPDLAEWVWHEV